MSDAADEIGDLAKAIAEQKSVAAAQAEPTQPVLIPPEIAGFAAAIPGRGIVAPNVRFRRNCAERAGAANTLIPVDISGLPETGYERLVGRDAGLRASTKRGATDMTNVLRSSPRAGGQLALVNEVAAGFGPTAIAARSCARMVVLGRGFEEHATGADGFLDGRCGQAEAKVS